MENKYNMTREQNVFVAKRNIVDYIYKSAKLEGLGVTYPDTEAIFKGAYINDGVKFEDALAVNNLKHAWNLVLDNLDYNLDYNFICEINRQVGNGNLIYGAGQLRNIPVTIGGTSWQPRLPIEIDIRENIAAITAITDATDRAISLMLGVMRWQMFLDGNKRTAMLAANHIMIREGAGIISVPEEKIRDFTVLLIAYYETGDEVLIKQFVYDYCIDGMVFTDN